LGKAKKQSINFGQNGFLKLQDVDAAGVAAGGGEFSPASGRSPHSSLSSPHVSAADSPRICFSPLKIRDAAIEDDDEVARGIQR
jgi:hypothetical protein